MLTTIKLVITACLMGYLVIGLLLYLNQSRYLYYPTPEVQGHGLEELDIRVDGATLKVYLLNPNQPEGVLYFGGNGESVVYNAADFSRQFSGKSVYLVNYRGYGGSSGKPGEAALYGDALAIYDQLATQHRAISVIGRSLGSGVATYLATQRPIKNLALVTPFDSIVLVAKQYYPYFPVSWLLKERYDSIGRAPKITTATLILIAGNDEVIAPAHARNLATAFRPEQLRVEVIEGAGHNNISQYRGYYEALQDFLY